MTARNVLFVIIILKKLVIQKSLSKSLKRFPTLKTNNYFFLYFILNVSFGHKKSGFLNNFLKANNRKFEIKNRFKKEKNQNKLQIKALKLKTKVQKISSELKIIETKCENNFFRFSFKFKNKY